MYLYLYHYIKNCIHIHQYLAGQIFAAKPPRLPPTLGRPVRESHQKCPKHPGLGNHSNLPRMIRPLLGGSFKHFFMFIPIWGNDPIWRAYFSNGLKPPTSLFYWDYYNPENERQEPQVCVGLPKGISSSRGPCSDSKPFVFRFCLGLWEYRHELVPVKNGIFAAEGFGFVTHIFSDRGDGEIHFFPIKVRFSSPKRAESLNVFGPIVRVCKNISMSPKVRGEFNHINLKSRKQNKKHQGSFKLFVPWCYQEKSVESF